MTGLGQSVGGFGKAVIAVGRAADGQRVAGGQRVLGGISGGVGHEGPRDA